jgi:hypothetical protein
LAIVATISVFFSSNIVVTGLPITDLFLNENHEDRWKKTDEKYKRIIWAPHFSISDGGCLNYSTFLSIAEEILDFVKTTSLPVQMAFKPHPLLKSQLYDYSSWGKEKTDLEEETVDEVLRILKSEFEEGEN